MRLLDLDPKRGIGCISPITPEQTHHNADITSSVKTDLPVFSGAFTGFAEAEETPMARQERAIRTRNEILRAAATVFNEFGYDAATIAETLTRADVTKGALYFHFQSKEDLARGCSIRR
ncbi:helix-turn-helix domain-containing protein [Streptomyces sp. M19]